MESFKLESKARSVLMGFMGLGVICLILTFLGDDANHTRFWSNYLHNSVFFTGIAFISLFTLCAFMTAYSGWHTVVKRIWESYSLFLIVGIVLMIPVIAGIWGHFHHLYHPYLYELFRISTWLNTCMYVTTYNLTIYIYDHTNTMYMM